MTATERRTQALPDHHRRPNGRRWTVTMVEEDLAIETALDRLRQLHHNHTPDDRRES